MFKAYLRRLRILLASRKLFHNWLSTGIRYYLIKHGLVDGSITARFRCGGERVYVLSPQVYSLIVNAYYDGLFSGLGCGDLVYLVLDYGGFRVRLHIDSVAFLGDIVRENFVGGAYDDLVVGGRVVVDVGAGVGDTAILFALRGARRVVALEPYPSLYGEAIINIRANGIEDKVALINAGLGSFDGEVCASANNLNEYTIFKPSDECGVRVRMYTLSSLIREFNIENGSILKMDCEGCEYETIPRASSKDLSVFSQIIIEYHNGYHELRNALEKAGFKVTIKPIRSAKIPIERQGYIIAKRKI
jgi:FkbM family methyltransferase